MSKYELQGQVKKVLTENIRVLIKKDDTDQKAVFSFNLPGTTQAVHIDIEDANTIDNYYSVSLMLVEQGSGDPFERRIANTSRVANTLNGFLLGVDSHEYSGSIICESYKLFSFNSFVRILKYRSVLF